MQRCERQLGIDPPGNGIADDLAAASIEKSCQIAEPDCDPNVCDIANPNDIGLGWDDVLVQVCEDRQVVIAVRRAHEAASWLDTETVLSHHPRNTFMIDDVAAFAELARYAPISITCELVLDLANEFDERRIGGCTRCLAGAVVVGAARQVNHFAPPSDGAAFGPLTIEQLSLLLTSCRGGVFLRSSSSIVS